MLHSVIFALAVHIKLPGVLDRNQEDMICYKFRGLPIHSFPKGQGRTGFH